MVLIITKVIPSHCNYIPGPEFAKLISQITHFPQDVWNLIKCWFKQTKTGPVTYLA